MTTVSSNLVSQEAMEINRAMQVLELYGVSPARAGTIHNGIEVLMTRMHRESVAHVAEIERLRAGLRRIGSVSASFKPVADRLLAGESIDAIADSPAETGTDAVRQGPDLEAIKEQAEQGIFVEHECPAFFACCAIVAEFHQDDSQNVPGEPQLPGQP